MCPARVRRHLPVTVSQLQAGLQPFVGGQRVAAIGAETARHPVPVLPDPEPGSGDHSLPQFTWACPVVARECWAATGAWGVLNRLLPRGSAQALACRQVPQVQRPGTTGDGVPSVGTEPHRTRIPDMEGADTCAGGKVPQSQAVTQAPVHGEAGLTEAHGQGGAPVRDEGHLHHDVLVSPRTRRHSPVLTSHNLAVRSSPPESA